MSAIGSTRLRSCSIARSWALGDGTHRVSALTLAILWRRRRLVILYIGAMGRPDGARRHRRYNPVDVGRKGRVSHGLSAATREWPEQSEYLTAAATCRVTAAGLSATTCWAVATDVSATAALGVSGSGVVSARLWAACGLSATAGRTLAADVSASAARVWATNGLWRAAVPCAGAASR